MASDEPGFADLLQDLPGPHIPNGSEDSSISFMLRTANIDKVLDPIERQHIMHAFELQPGFAEDKYGVLPSSRPIKSRSGDIKKTRGNMLSQHFVATEETPQPSEESEPALVSILDNKRPLTIKIRTGSMGPGDTDAPTDAADEHKPKRRKRKSRA